MKRLLCVPQVGASDSDAIHTNTAKTSVTIRGGVPRVDWNSFLRILTTNYNSFLHLRFRLLQSDCAAVLGFTFSAGLLAGEG